MNIKVDIEDFHIPVKRLEIMDHTAGGVGRITVLNGEECMIGFSLQDNNQTLKIVVSEVSK